MRRLAALAVLAVLLLVLVVGQFVLPRIAASMLRDRLAKAGQVISVDVSAFPAIELLWHDADTVTVRLASYRSSTGHLTSLLDQASGVGTLHASVGVLHAGLLTLHGASLSKQGNTLRGGATVTQSDLRAAIPLLQSVSFVSSSGGVLTLSGTVSVIGVTAAVPAVIRPAAGRLVVSIQVPFVNPSFTVFADPRVRVEGVAGAATPGGLSLSARGSFR
jgi:hypothetical protein